MRFSCAALIAGMAVLTSYGQSKLVVYGPEDLITQFNSLKPESDQKNSK